MYRSLRNAEEYRRSNIATENYARRLITPTGPDGKPPAALSIKKKRKGSMADAIKGKKGKKGKKGDKGKKGGGDVKRNGGKGDLP